jgi:ubiquinone biosynthesis protein
LFDEIQKKAPYWREKMPEMPDLFYQTLKQQQQMQASVQQQAELLARQSRQNSRRAKGQFYSIIGAALFIGCCILYSSSGQWQAPESLTAIGSVIAFIISRSFQDK